MSHLPNVDETDWQDEIIMEVRANREALAAEHDYDIRRLFAELKRREQASDRPKVEPSPKLLSPAAKEPG